MPVLVFVVIEIYSSIANTFIFDIVTRIPTKTLFSYQDSSKDVGQTA